MSEKLPRAKPNQHDLEVAADWFSQLRDGDAGADKVENWKKWLSADCRHQSAWEQIIAITGRFDAIQEQHDEQRLGEILTERQNKRINRRYFLGGMAAIAVTSGVGWIHYRYDSIQGLARHATADHATHVGQIKALKNYYGYRVWLNTSSAVRQSIANTQPIVDILSGEAFFRTNSTHATTPIIQTDHGLMNATGTEFNIKTTPNSTLLTVFDGWVKVTTSKANQQRIINAGEQVQFNASEFDQVQSASGARRAWIKGILLAEDITLNALMKEMSPFYGGKISISEDAKYLKVFGAYPLTDFNKTLAMLADILPIEVQTPLPFWTRISIRSQKR